MIAINALAFWAIISVVFIIGFCLFSLLGINDLKPRLTQTPAQPAPSEEDALDIATIKKISAIFYGYTDHGNPMIRMDQARAAMAEHDTALRAQLAEKTEENAQRAADKYCDLMDKSGHACSPECECWHRPTGGCEDAQDIYRAALDGKEPTS